LYQPETFNGSGGFGVQSPAAGDKGVWEQSPQRFAIFGIYYKNNAFLGMFLLLKTFQTYSLLRLNT